MSRPAAAAATALLCLFASGCRGCDAARAPAPSATPAPSAAGAPSSSAPQAEGGASPVKPVPPVLPPVVARVNGEEILRADLERSVRGVETELNQRMPADKRDGVVRGVLERLINYRLLLQEARARGIEVPQAEAEAQVAALARQFPSEEALRAALIRRGVTIDMLREDARRDLRVAKLVRQETGRDAKVPDADVRRFYDANLEKFRQPDSARAAHVFVRTPAGADEKTINAMRVRAEAILRLAQRGDDFAALARNYSEDRVTAAKGGDLGWFNRGATPKEFDAAVFALQPGRPGGPVRTTDGYHVITVRERRPSRIQPFDEVRQDLAAFLLRELQDRMTVQLIKQLRGNARIEILL